MTIITWGGLGFMSDEEGAAGYGGTYSRMVVSYFLSQEVGL